MWAQVDNILGEPVRMVVGIECGKFKICIEIDVSVFMYYNEDFCVKKNEERFIIYYLYKVLLNSQYSI